MRAPSRPGTGRKWSDGVMAVGIFAGLLLLGCGRTPPAPSETTAPPAARVRATDFVLCIDNSASISPSQQILIREIAMLLADLAEPGDRVSLITFGVDARLAASVPIRAVQDKVAFKKVVQSDVTFRENYSDIRAGLRVMAENVQTLFRPSGAMRAPILLTDGKLEPADHKAAGAFAQMQEYLRGPLAQTSIYAVVLGDTTSQDAILPNLNGLTLMQQYVARGPEYFYHAHSLDQLLDVTVAILSKAKGISSLGGEGKDAVQDRSDGRIDDLDRSEEIVRRRGVLCVLCHSAEAGPARAGRHPEQQQPDRGRSPGGDVLDFRLPVLRPDYRE